MVIMPTIMHLFTMPHPTILHLLHTILHLLPTTLPPLLITQLLHPMPLHKLLTLPPLPHTPQSMLHQLSTPYPPPQLPTTQILTTPLLTIVSLNTHP